MSQAGTAEARAAGHLVTDADGYVYDPETGEVYAVTDPHTEAVVWLKEWEGAPPTAAGERFTVRDDDAANWVLQLIMREEAALDAIEAQIAAVVANLEGMKVDHRNRLKSLDWRFKGELEQFARRKLEESSGKSKTVKLPYGKLSFRTSKGSNDILDKGRALEFVEEWAPETITKSPNVTGMLAAIERAEQEMGEAPDTGEFFRRAEPRETFTVDTGLAKG